MARGYWTHSPAEKRRFAQQMSDIDGFCRENDIEHIEGGGTYRFTVRGRKYIVSNIHVPKEAQIKDTTYIYAGQTRLIEIYSDLKKGAVLDSRGNRKNKRKDSDD